MREKKTVRMLLRVSSNHQLEADGDLSVQRNLVEEYVARQKDWILDSKEYFEGSSSGYKNSIKKRKTLQEALTDAENREYDILVAYKDDRVGRRMWEMGVFVMALKSFGVDIYTVKDGCISPDTDDIMGQMMLALRYGNAQKSSSDTGMRVKDTAGKLVQKGRFMGGKAPYGYELVLSGALSKHGRALHRLKIIPEQAEMVRYIFSLSYYKDYGSGRIVKVLNEEEYCRNLAPNDLWKRSTVTSILTNPVYVGHVAYNRRERTGGRYHRLDSSKWIISSVPDESIRIIDSELWNKVQMKRNMRAHQYQGKKEAEKGNIVRSNVSMLSLTDVSYCGYCGGKLTNGSRYYYWTTKKSGEKKSKKIPMYQCQNAKQGAVHNPTKQFRAEEVEKIVYPCIEEYIGKLCKQEEIEREIQKKQKQNREKLEADLHKDRLKLQKIRAGIMVMESHVPDAMTGEYALGMEELADMIRQYKKREEMQVEQMLEREARWKKTDGKNEEREGGKFEIPTWQQVFRETDTEIKRNIVNHLIERIEVTKEQIVIRFRIGTERLYP